MENPAEPDDVLRIVIPLHTGGGKLGDDAELRFALRSLAAHVKEPYEIVIAGSALPEWASGLRRIEAGGLKSALAAAAAAFPAGFMWWYDDCVLLRDSTAAELGVTPCCRGWRKPGSGWSKKLEKVRQRLVAEGMKAWDYSRPHGPYFFDKGMVDEGFRDWPGMAAKFPWESWILSKRDWPRVHGAVRQYYGAFKGAPGPGQRYLNYNNRGFTLELRDWLRARFPEKSPWENDNPMSKKEIYGKQALHVQGVWEELGRPPLRTICECATGPWSLLAGFEGLARRTLLIEPDPEMAAAARRNYPWAEVRQVAVAREFGTANLRKLNGSSYIKGIPWAPAFDVCPDKARKAGKVPVATVPFSVLDDGEIDLLNLDCEGSEWYVLEKMKSRPRILQVELYPKHGHHREISAWLEAHGYQVAKRWGNANLILTRAAT